MKRTYVFVAASFLPFAFGASPGFSEGNASSGQRIFGACAACHSLQPDQNMTGPSLAGLWNRKAGTLPSFTRYSTALQSSNVVWNDKTLDDWIADPAHVVPGNQMTFAGVKDARQRADLLAFLKDATQPESSVAQQGAPMGRGMMGGGQIPNLKRPDPAERVQEITYCKDTYTITTADGQTRKFWERNLRFAIYV